MDTAPSFEQSLEPDACKLVKACVSQPNYVGKLRRLFAWISWHDDQKIALERLKTIGHEDLEAYAEGAGGMSPSAYNYLVAALRTLGQEANTSHNIQLPGLFRLKTRKVIEHTYPILTPDQAKAIIFWKDEPDYPLSASYSAMYALNYSLGLLPATMYRLNLEDYRPVANAQLTVKSKGGVRELPILPKVAKVIDRHLEDWPALGLTDPLFPNNNGDRQTKGWNYHLESTRRAVSLGIPFKVGAREFREAFKAHMLAAGAPHKVLKDIMGVASLDTADLIGKRERGYEKADEREPR